MQTRELARLSVNAVFRVELILLGCEFLLDNIANGLQVAQALLKSIDGSALYASLSADLFLS